MRSVWVLTIAALMLVGCGAEQQTEEGAEKSSSKTASTKKQEKKAAEEPKEDPIDNIRITYENAVEVLTKYGERHPETKVLIETPMGNMTLQLYKDTPLHRANFIRLVKKGYYDQTIFFRVVKEFMIQGGTSDEAEIQQLQGTLGTYLIPAEFNPRYYHKKGAIAMARLEEGNPEKKSAPYSFYIVHGTTYTPNELKGIEMGYEIKFTPEQIETYTTVGGASYLDFDHTVFGEITDGFEVIDKIAAVEVDRRNWPDDDVWVKMKVIE